MDTNPYAPPTANVLARGAASGLHAGPDDVSQSELAAFAADPKYPGLWLQRAAGQRRLAGFNWWAAVFGIQWFFFRKLYVQGLVSIVLEAGIPFLFGAAAVAIVRHPDDPAVAYTLLASALATRVGIGFWANLALYRKAVRTIRSVDALNLDNESHLRAIARAGGVSVPALLAVYVAMGLLRFLPDLLR
jgi:hypothetical protein